MKLGPLLMQNSLPGLHALLPAAAEGYHSQRRPVSWQNARRNGQLTRAASFVSRHVWRHEEFGQDRHKIEQAVQLVVIKIFFTFLGDNPFAPGTQVLLPCEDSRLFSRCRGRPEIERSMCFCPSSRRVHRGSLPIRIEWQRSFPLR